MAEYGPLVPGDEFVSNSPGHIGMARLVRTKDPNKPLELKWAPGAQQSRTSGRVREISTIQHLFYGLCDDYIKPLNKNLELGELVQNENGEYGEVVDMNWLVNVEVPKKEGAAFNVHLSKLEPIMKFYKGERIYLNGWLGVVTRVISEYRLRNPYFNLCNFALRNGLTDRPTFDVNLTKCYTLFRHQDIELPKYHMPDLLWVGVPSFARGRSREFRVLEATLTKVGVDWIEQIPGNEASQPKSEITGEELTEVSHFDSWALPQYRKINFCYFREASGVSGKAYPIVRKKLWKHNFFKTMFIKEVASDDNSSASSASGAEEDKENCTLEKDARGVDARLRPGTPAGPPPKISKLGGVQEAVRTSPSKTSVPKKAKKTTAPSSKPTTMLADGDVVDVALLQQIVTVAWNNKSKTVSESMSRDLRRLSTKPCLQFRQFVQLKDSPDHLISHGVTVQRFLDRKQVEVQWFHVVAEGWAQADLQVLSEDAIESHSRFASLRLGELVVRDPSRPERCLLTNPDPEVGEIPFSFGIIVGIDLNFGTVRVESLNGRLYEVRPDDLLIVSASNLRGNTAHSQTLCSKSSTEFNLSIEGASGDAGSSVSDIRRAFSSPFDLAYEKDLQILQSPDNRLPRGVLVRGFADSPYQLSMLVIGPVDTPYEDGVFMFDFKLPVNYPTVSPSFQLVSNFSRTISHNVDAQGMVDVPFLTGWRGVEKWSPNCTIVDAIAAVTNTIFVSEPADNTLHMHYRRYTSDPAVRCPGAMSEEDAKRRGAFNLSVMMEVLDSLIQLALNPAGVWNDVITAHLKVTLPKILSKYEDWIMGLPNDSAENVERTRFSVPTPIPDGFLSSLATRVHQLSEIINPESLEPLDKENSSMKK